jgi:hypothetical protein
MSSEDLLLQLKILKEQGRKVASWLLELLWKKIYKIGEAMPLLPFLFSLCFVENCMCIMPATMHKL